MRQITKAPEKFDLRKSQTKGLSVMCEVAPHKKLRNPRERCRFCQLRDELSGL